MLIVMEQLLLGYSTQELKIATLSYRGWFINILNMCDLVYTQWYVQLQLLGQVLGC
jgi:hypothetical protein